MWDGLFEEEILIIVHCCFCSNFNADLKPSNKTITFSCKKEIQGTFSHHDRQNKFS